MAKAESFSRSTYAEISSENFMFNLNYLRQKASHEFFCPMVKADAYGHGDKHISQLAQMAKVEFLGIVTIEEGLSLRNAGFLGSVLCFASDYKSLLPTLLKYKITPVISALEHLEHLSNLSAHIEIDTAMHRMGFSITEIERLIALCKEQKIQVEGVMTHFSNGKDIYKENSFALKQKKIFTECVSKYFKDVKYKHIYSSDSLLLAEDTSDFGARPGISLYGYSAMQNQDLKPVMRLKTRIVKLNQVKKSEGVSYGPIWRAKKDSLIAVLPIGYGDGLKRALSNKYTFLCNGKKIPQIGAVCMDYCMANVSELKHVKVGDDVYIFGYDQKSVYEQAKLEGTIPYEILTSITNRVPRVLVEKFT